MLRWDLPEDVEHRSHMREQHGPRCCCAEYTAISGTLHPDCPEHGHAEMTREDRARRSAER